MEAQFALNSFNSACFFEISFFFLKQRTFFPPATQMPVSRETK